VQASVALNAAWQGYSPSSSSPPASLLGIPGSASPSHPLSAIVRRDARSSDQSLAAFAVGWAGTVLPLFLRPTASGSDLLIGQALQVAGLVLQLVAVLSLGRSFGVVAADRGIKTGGAYRFVRHPIYAAYLLADIGFVISHPTVGNVAAIAAAAATQVIRIWFEERHLAGNPDYQEFCMVRRWRLVPGVW
jgi:protein-S-isoprenylcysteine O-methyltransferase Ste14